MNIADKSEILLNNRKNQFGNKNDKRKRFFAIKELTKLPKGIKLSQHLKNCLFFVSNSFLTPVISRKKL